MKATARATASTSSAARVRRPTPTVRRSASATSASARGRSAPAHPCFGCTEKETAFRKPIHALATVKSLTPPNAFPQVGAPGGQGMSVGAAVTVGAIAGVVVGAGAMLLKEMTDKPEKPGEEA